MNKSCVIRESTPPRTDESFAGRNIQYKKNMMMPTIALGAVMAYPIAFFQWNEYVQYPNPSDSYVFFGESAPFINRVTHTAIGKTDKNVTEAPLWLLDRRKALQQRPPPSLQKMRTQWKAAAEALVKLDDRRIF